MTALASAIHSSLCSFPRFIGWDFHSVHKAFAASTAEQRSHHTDTFHCVTANETMAENCLQMTLNQLKVTLTRSRTDLDLVPLSGRRPLSERIRPNNCILSLWGVAEVLALQEQMDLPKVRSVCLVALPALAHQIKDLFRAVWRLV